MNTKDKIEVMSAYLDGEQIEIDIGNGWEEWQPRREPAWEWDTNNYRVKPKLDTSILFEGAPVVYNDRLLYVFNIEPTDIGLAYHIGSEYKYSASAWRLPTVEESPRNVWLACDGKEPEGFNDGINVLIWNNDNIVRHIGTGNWVITWPEIKRWMILED